jgi:hypothetical protein
MSEPEVKIKIVEPETKPGKKKKNSLRHSNFFLTVNTNKYVQPMSEEAEEVVIHFIEGLKNIFTKDKIKLYVKFKKEGHTFTNQFIRDVKVEAVPEIGEVQNRLHVHILLAFSHRSCIHLDLEKIKNEFMKEFNLENIYINVRSFFDAKANFEDYMNKMKLAREFAKNKNKDKGNVE